MSRPAHEPRRQGSPPEGGRPAARRARADGAAQHDGAPPASEAETSSAAYGIDVQARKDLQAARRRLEAAQRRTTTARDALRNAAAELRALRAEVDLHEARLDYASAVMSAERAGNGWQTRQPALDEARARIDACLGKLEALRRDASPPPGSDGASGSLAT